MERTPINVLAVAPPGKMAPDYVDILRRSRDPEHVYRVRTVENAKEVEGELISQRPDLVILDANLGERICSELCKFLRRSESPYIGIIIVTRQSTPEQSTKWTEWNVDDFCGHDVINNEIIGRLRSIYRIKEMTDSLKATNEKLRKANTRLAKLTITDELTSLHNMRYFKKRLQQEFVRSQRYGLRFSLIMFDIDHFKVINDQFDHLMGSFVLTEIGQLVLRSIRSVDIGARFGGDEYVILLPQTGRGGARALADRIAEDIRETVYDNGIFKGRVTASVGVCTYDGREGQFANSMAVLRRADAYLYEAKAKGRGMVIDQSNSDQFKLVTS